MRSTSENALMKQTYTKKELVQYCEHNIESSLVCALSLLDIVRFDKKNGQQLTVVCLFARIVELAASCKALLEKNALTGLPVLLRSMFEADIDLTNCINEENYFKNMYASLLKEKIKRLKESFPEKDNPYLEPIDGSDSLESELEATENEYETLKIDGYKPLGIKDRSEKAGKIAEYHSIYNILCLDTHNNIASLEKNYLEHDNAQDDYQVAIFNATKEDHLAFISAIPGIIFHRIMDLINFFQLENFDIQDAFRNFKNTQQALEMFANSELSNLRVQGRRKASGASDASR